MNEVSVAARGRLCQLAASMFGQAFKDWSEMLGFKGDVGASMLRFLPATPGLLQRIVGSQVLMMTRIEVGGVGGPVYFVIPATVLGTALADALMLRRDGSAPPDIDWENKGHADAVKELVNLFCGSATTALTEAGLKARISQSVSDLVVHRGEFGDDLMTSTHRTACIQVKTVVGAKDATAWCLISERVAAALCNN